MSFAAYQARHDGTDFSFRARDDSAGILGSFRPDEAPPVVMADTLEELEQAARAYLGREPGAFLYLTDADLRVHRMVINEKHHAAISRAEDRTTISVVLLVFSVTCLVGAALGPLGPWALWSFAGAIAFYTLVLASRFLNEIEGAVVCEILLILALLLISGVQQSRGRIGAERVGGHSAAERAANDSGGNRVRHSVER